ncbi:Chromate resistance protein ChrB [Paenibacillus sp. OV219]|uniref:Chromate resistance protein ChrB n=1 Tax=Paenibacillus sp. OV219 TaxID=1884377 RepID=UPI0008B56072|nr:Chromate resistance protein ChrB [Paenibacillus sp. OV219]SEP16231.1 hypothetical protein SAMN05518847_1229 [Paenibacillus sp. OV219]
MKTWILLTYKIPPKPSANRVYIWRKLKKFGAVLVHDSIWVLPSRKKSKEHFQWLAAEISEMNGDAMVWEADSALIGQEQSLIDQFRQQVEEEYKCILESLQQLNADLHAEARKYQHTLQKDYFESALGLQVRDLFLKLRGRPD